jgi:hypothetical protein
MKAVIGKILAAIGWFLGFLFIAAFAVEALPTKYGSPVWALFIGVPAVYAVEYVWLRLAWNTMKVWFNKPVAVATIALMVLIFAGIMYVGWRGVQS